jgi:hypothetical protein
VGKKKFAFFGMPRGAPRTRIRKNILRNFLPLNCTTCTSPPPHLLTFHPQPLPPSLSPPPPPDIHTFWQSAPSSSHPLSALPLALCPTQDRLPKLTLPSVIEETISLFFSRDQKLFIFIYLLRNQLSKPVKFFLQKNSVCPWPSNLFLISLELRKVKII